MFATRNLGITALCGLLSPAGLSAQTTQQELVATLASKDWQIRNEAAKELLPQAAKLSAEATEGLWKLALPAWGFFEQPKYPSFDATYHGPGREQLQALGYHQMEGVFVPRKKADLCVPHDAQTLALMILLRGPQPEEARWKRCLGVALHESEPTAAAMLPQLCAKFGDAARDEIVNKIVDAAASGEQPKALVALLRLLPAFGKKGWQALRVFASGKEYETLRKAALRVIGVHRRGVEWDLFAAQRFFLDDECEGELCGLLAVKTVDPEDPTAMRYFADQFGEWDEYCQVCILAVIGQGRFVGRAHTVATGIVEEALNSNDEDVLELALRLLGRRGRVALRPATEKRLLQLLRRESLQERVTSTIKALAARNDAFRDRMVTAGALTGSGVRRLYVADDAPGILDRQLSEEFATALAAAKPSERLRVARDLADKPWQKRLNGLRPVLRKRLASADATAVRPALDLIVMHAETLSGFLPNVRQLVLSEDASIRQCAYRALVQLAPSTLPGTIEAGNVDGTIGRATFTGKVPVADLVALLNHERSSARETAARFLGLIPGATSEKMRGLLHPERRIRLNVWSKCRQLRDLPQAAMNTAAEQWRKALADESASWDLRMDAGRYLVDRGLLSAADIEVLIGFDAKLEQGSVPQEWNSAVWGQPLEEQYPPPTRWELYSAIKRTSHTPAMTAWLQKHAGKPRSSVFRSWTKQLLLHASRRAAIAAAAEQWFAEDETTRGKLALPNYSYSREDARVLVPMLFAALQKAAAKNGRETLPPLHLDDPQQGRKPSAIKAGDYEFPYVLLTKGDKPATGWPLYICLHGGGGNGKAKGPHSWRVNTREWQAQQMLFDRVYKDPGLYFIPRMADDRRGRWWHDHNQIAFADVIEQCILFRDVDPNRVYMMGISEGGYGAIRFAANRPDRFAATGGMAAAEPMHTSPPENMRNVAMRIDIGEKDTMFDRVGLARRMGERLAELHSADPDGYDFAVNVQKGRGHGIDYSLTPQWLAKRVRDPAPKRVVWTVQKFDSRLAKRHHWLRIADKPDGEKWFVDARVERGDLEVTVERAKKGGDREPVTSGSIVVLLDDRLASLDYDLDVVVNGKGLPPIKVRRSLDVMLRTMAERCDPQACFCAEVVIDLAGPTVR